jgi:hypothetical protein
MTDENRLERAAGIVQTADWRRTIEVRKWPSRIALVRPLPWCRAKLIYGTILKLKPYFGTVSAQFLGIFLGTIPQPTLKFWRQQWQSP